MTGLLVLDIEAKKKKGEICRKDEAGGGEEVSGTPEQILQRCGGIGSREEGVAGCHDQETKRHKHWRLGGQRRHRQSATQVHGP